MHQEKVPSEFQGPGGAAEQILRRAVVFPPGGGMGSAGWPTGKIGRIGDTAGKTAGGKNPGHLTQIHAYTLHTGFHLIPADVLHGGLMSGGTELHAGNPAGGIHAAQQQAQGAAAGAQIQHPGVPGQPDEVSQGHGVGAQGKASRRYLQGDAVGQIFQERLPPVRKKWGIRKIGLRRSCAGQLQAHVKISLPRLRRWGTAQRRSRRKRRHQHR